VAIHNVGQNEGKLGAVRAINNSKPLRVNFLDDSYFCQFSACKDCSRSASSLATVEQATSLFIVLSACLPESDQGDRHEAAFAFCPQLAALTRDLL